MADHAPRLFAHPDEIAAIGDGLLACTLEKSRWTHEAHLAATVWLVRTRVDILPERDMRAIICKYNVSTGVVNDDRGGYHETLTQFYIATVRTFLDTRPAGEPLLTSCNALLLAPEGRRDFPLSRYSEAWLFSVAARRGHVPPDLTPLPGKG